MIFRISWISSVLFCAAALPLLLAAVDLGLRDGDHGAEEVVHFLEWRTARNVNRPGGLATLALAPL